MASHRVSRSTAELVAIPPTTWYVKTVSWLLEQEEIVKNIHSVPVNEELLESLKNFKMLNPILCLPSWYPLVGSQRVRACQHLKETEPDSPVLSQEIRVAKFDAEYWNAFYLWGEEDFRSKAISVYFQMIELAWKSIHYLEDSDFANIPMTRFEDIGDEMKWENVDMEEYNKKAMLIR
jgi:hypothetical protein